MERVRFRFGEWVYDPQFRSLLSLDQTLTLEPRVADVLELLAAAQGPVSRDQLLDEVWGMSGSDEALTQAISKLRRAINDRERPFSKVRTIPGEGYQLDAEPILGETELDRYSSPNKPNRASAAVGPANKFLLGLGAGVALTLSAIALIMLLAWPRQVEEEIICFDDSAKSCKSALASETVRS